MSDSHSHDHIAKHVRVYITVFVALLIGTLVTVGMYSVHFESVALTVAIAVIIASVKAFLVAGFFMHLVSEKRSIYTVLAVTGFFFAGLMALTIWAMHDFPDNTANTQQTFHTAPAPAPHVP
jgi:cytochrome c oxidase subunit IV